MENVNVENVVESSESSSDSVVTEQSEALTTENIQKALAATRSKATADAPATSDAPAVSKRPRLSDEEKARREEVRNAEKAAKKVAREAKREAKKAAKAAEASTKVAHMAKVDKAALMLPAITEDAQDAVDEICANYGSTEVTAIIAHLQHRQRVNATASASLVKLTENQMVRITSADGPAARYIGQLAQVVTVQRIRCYVTPVGTDKKVYLFNSNVSPLSSDELEALPSSEGEVQAATG